MKEFLKNPKFQRGFLWAVLIAAAALLAYALWSLIVEFQAFKYSGYLRRQRAHHLQRGVAQFDAGKIAGWMTFKYINLIFNLAPEYLKNQLQITDKRYPDLPVDSAAKTRKLGPARFLQKTISAVKDYPSP